MKQNTHNITMANTKSVCKKLLCSTALFAAAITVNAQTPQNWTTEPMTVEATNEAKFGTANKKSVEFYTNGKKQAVLDTNGKIKLLRYVNGDMPDDWGNLPLYINKRGEITINAKGIGGGVQSEGELGCGSCIQPAPPCQVSLTGNGYSGSVPCLSSFAQSWREGGNRLDTSECSSSSNIIGTCNRFDFVMKANDTSAIFLKTDGRVNIGVDNDVLI